MKDPMEGLDKIIDLTNRGTLVDKAQNASKFGGKFVAIFSESDFGYYWKGRRGSVGVAYAEWTPEFYGGRSDSGQYRFLAALSLHHLRRRDCETGTHLVRDDAIEEMLGGPFIRELTQAELYAIATNYTATDYSWNYHDDTLSIWQKLNILIN